MGKVIMFDRSRSSKPKLPDLEVERPKDRALKRLAENLGRTRFSNRDRAQVAANWHTILKDLKRNHRLGSKEKVYEVLKKPNSNDSAQKKSWNYELPPTLADAARAKRIEKLVQRGDKWLKLAERAADLVGMGRHDLLPDLLKGTSIAPLTTTSDLEALDPIACLLQLANAACAKIATKIDLKQYFADWKPFWVHYSFRDGKFIPEPVDEADRADWVTTFGRSENELSEELSDRPFVAGLPLPYVSFGTEERFGFPARLVPHLDESGLADAALPIVEVIYVREYGLAIAINAYDGAIAPALEVRHYPVLRDAKTGEHIPFWPVSGFPDAHGFFERYYEDKDRAEHEGDEPTVYGLSGEVDLAGRKYWAWLVPQMTAEDVANKELAQNRDRYPEQKTEIEIHYSLLTPQAAKTILEVGFHATREIGDRHTLTDTEVFGSGLRILEAMLLEGTADGTLFDLLLQDARRKVEGFRQAYGVVLRRVQEDHRNAMSKFS
jgi:hypothetical protein